MSKPTFPSRRTRTQSNRSPFSGRELYVYGGTTSVSTNYGTFAGYGQQQTMTDTIGAPPRRDLGIDGFSYNPMDYTKDIIGGASVGYSVTLKSNGANWYSDGNITPQCRNVLGFPVYDSVPLLVPQSTLDMLQATVATKCLAQRGKGDVNNFENIFQFSKTLDELRHPFQNFALWSNRWVDRFEGRVRKIHGSRKIRVRQGVELPLDLYASAWLQYRYGVRLLIHDVEQVLKDVNQISEQRKLVTERAQKSISDSYRSNPAVVNWGVTKWDTSYTIDETITVRATSHDEYALDTLQQIGLSGKNLLTVGWELIPYSFVADWFGNIGDFLAASVPTPNIRHVGECLSTKRITTFVGKASFAGMNNSLYSGTGSPGHHSITTIRYSRGNTLGSGPSLSLNPDFGLLRPVRAADAVALAFGALTRAFGVNGRIRLSTS